MALRLILCSVALAALTMAGCRSSSSYRPSYYQARPAVVATTPAPATPAPCPNGQVPPPPPPAGF